MKQIPPLPAAPIHPLIHLIRGRRIILDSDLAALSGVATHRFNEAVKRNTDRFPEGFRFQLSRGDVVVLTDESRSASSEVPKDKSVNTNSSQFAMRSRPKRATAYLSLPFTEHGALMAANVLRSPRAMAVSVHVIRAFLDLRDSLALHRELGVRRDELERKSAGHDASIADLCEAIRVPLAQPEPGHDRKIGFHQA